MESISFFFNTLPFTLTLILFIRYALCDSNTNYQDTIKWILFFTAGFFFQHGAMYNPRATALQLTIADVVGHICAPTLLYLIFRNLYYYHKVGRDMRRVNWLLAVPLVVTFVTIMSFVPLEWHEIEHFWQFYAKNGYFYPKELVGNQWIELFYLLNLYFYFIVCFICTVGVLAYIIYCMIREKFGFGDLFNYLFHGGEMTPFKMTFLLSFVVLILTIFRIMLGRAGSIQFPLLTIIISFVNAMAVFDIARIGMLPNLPEFTLNDFLHPFALRVQALDNVNSHLAISSSESEQQLLQQRFIELMDQQHVFVDAALTIDDVALMLNSNRVQLAYLINEVYHLPFRDYLNMKRIEYAKQLMTERPLITQQDLAAQCGFMDAAAFNKRFTQMEGITPFKWRKQR
ncbi:MAG: helix-turn-helix domain-containing protein [Paludibacteraceae bacterium]|nr:helix-turn-helix domain-containing protein [Paludibacteraceae bacterium]